MSPLNLEFQMMEKKDSSKRSDNQASARHSSGQSAKEVEGWGSGYPPHSQGPTILPLDYTPRAEDVICGRGKNSARHNEWYTDHLRNNAHSYLVSNQSQRITIIEKILATCRSRGAYFVKAIDNTDRWEEIGHAIRDQLNRMGKPIKGSLHAAMRKSESVEESNTDTSKHASSQHGIRRGKNKSKEDNMFDDKKRPSRRPLKHPTSLDSAEPAWTIDSSEIRQRTFSNFSNPNEMSNRRPSNISQSDFTAARSGDLSRGIAHQSRASSLHGGVRAFATNTSSYPEMLDYRAATNLDVPPSAVRSLPERAQLPLQWMQHLPPPHTLDNSDIGFVPMANGVQVGAPSANNSYFNPNDPHMIASSFQIHNQYAQHQYFPRMNDTLSFLPYDSSTGDTNVAMPFNSANITQSSNFIQPTTMVPSLHATHALPIDNDPLPQGEGDGNEGLTLSFSLAFEPNVGVQDNEGEHEKHIDAVDDLYFADLGNDEGPEPL
jgi:hypothetical protein